MVFRRHVWRVAGWKYVAWVLLLLGPWLGLGLGLSGKRQKANLENFKVKLWK